MLGLDVPDGSREQLADMERELARLLGEVVLLKNEVNGTSGHKGIRDRLHELANAQTILGERLMSLDESVDRAVASLTLVCDKAQAKIDELRISSATRSAVENERERVNKRWVAPVLMLLLTIILSGIGTAVASVAMSKHRNVEMKEAAQEAAREAVRTIRVRLPAGTSTTEVP